MPVRSISCAWYSAIHWCPFAARSRNSSSSALYPGAIRFPSVSRTLGSSAMPRSIRSTTSVSGESVAAMPESVAQPGAMLSLIPETGRSDSARDLRSLALARPESTLAMSRSRSRTPSSLDCRSDILERSSTRASTASRRAFMSSGRRRGCLIHVARRRAPIGVFVAFSVPKSDASLVPPSPGSNARWRIVPASIASMSDDSTRRMERTWSTAWCRVVCT